jgi:serine-type D-Ala-D-Ala carboxypeptidase/endopeptidase (penicillin-binding protein 4)
MHEKTNVGSVRWAALFLALLSALYGVGCESVSGTQQARSTNTAPVATQPASNVSGHDETLAKRIDAIFDGTGATAAVRVIELPSRRELYAREADRPVMPASNMKLVTTAMALDHFGPDHKFET